MRNLILGFMVFFITNFALAQSSVVVSLTDDLGAALTGVNVYAFTGTAYSGSSAVSDSNGDATFSLAAGDYRFRADVNGTQYFSSSVNDCTTPACTVVSVQIPRAVQVTATSSGGGVEAGLTVYAFDGTAYAGKSAVTDASGVASLQLPVGNYRFRIDKNGTQFFTSPSNNCSTPGCTAVSFEVPESVTVTVTSGGVAETGLTVYAFDGSTYAGKSAVTDINGEATFTLLAGNYRFRIDKSGTQYFTDASNHCAVPGCNAAAFDIPAQVNVNVTSSAGGPEAGLTVYAFTGSSYQNKSAVTDASGVATFTLLSGDYRFRVDKNGTQFFTSVTNDCVVPGCTDAAYEIPEDITVSVTNSSGAAEAGLTVYAFDGSTYANKSAITDINGQATFTLVPGSYRFRIDKNGTQYFTSDVNDCTAPGCNAVAYQIPENVTVTVTSSAGGFESGLTVYAFDGSTYAGKSTITNATGEAEFTLLPGNYRFRIDKNDTQFFTSNVNNCAAPGCTLVAYEIPENVAVTVTSGAGGFESGLIVYAFDGSTYAGKSALTDVNGLATFTLLPGDYRFRIDKNGTQFFTNTVNDCTTPGCAAISYQVPESTTVNVTNTAGGVESGLTVYAFDESTYANKSAVTDSNGDALFTLLPGSYRFRTDKGGSQFFSNPVNHCEVPGCTGINQILPASLSSFVVDPALGACLDSAASANGWSTPMEVTSLSCPNANISNLKGLDTFSNITDLNLSGNPITLLNSLSGLTNLINLDLSNTTLLECHQLGDLETALGTGVIVQPSSCLGEGELVFSVINPNQIETNQFSFAVDATVVDDFVASAITYNPVTDAYDGRVYLIDGTNGEELLEIVNPAPTGSDYFGWSVASMQNGDIVVGAWQDDSAGVASGAVHIFSGTDGSLVRTIENPSPAIGDRFGYSLAVTVNDALVVGAYQQAGGGAVYVFDIAGNLQQTISNPGTDSNAEFGKALATTRVGDIVIGAPKQDVSGQVTAADAGVVYVVREIDGALQLSIDNPQAAVNDDFGSAVAVAANGDVIVSARMIDNNAVNDGRVFVHSAMNGGLLWSVANPVADVDGLFGTSLVASPQGHVIVGAANDDTGATNSGKLFAFNGLDGSLIDVINNPMPAANVNFGQGIAVTSQGQIAVGAFGANGGFGELYLFSSIRTGEALELLNAQDFPDMALQSCVQDQAALNAWATVSEVTSLNCSAQNIADLTGLDALTELENLDLSNNELTDISVLESLSNLTSLDLSGNQAIACPDLDSLDSVLGEGIVSRPVPCGGGGIGTQSVQNLHNAMGQRAVKSVDGGTAGTIHFIYDQSGRVIAEIDATTGSTLREYIYVNGVQVALVDDTGTQDEEVYFVHTDHLATPQKITDSQQTVVWSGSYEPFGEVEETIASIENNIRFPGQYEDGEIGLHYNYFRDYDPSLGRYVESDPIGVVRDYSSPVLQSNINIGVLDQTGFGEETLNNLYGYVGQSPVFWFDPYGLAKGNKGRIKNSKFANLSDKQVSERARDKSKSSAERREYQKEEKARSQRNKSKRRNSSGKGNRGGFRSGLPFVALDIACSSGVAPCGFCDPFGFYNPSCVHSCRLPYGIPGEV